MHSKDLLHNILLMTLYYILKAVKAILLLSALTTTQKAKLYKEKTIQAWWHTPVITALW